MQCFSVIKHGPKEALIITETVPRASIKQSPVAEQKCLWKNVKVYTDRWITIGWVLAEMYSIKTEKVGTNVMQ